MKKFLIYILIVIMGVVVVDVAYRFFIQSIFNNPRADSKIAAMYQFISCNDEASVIFLGASKANHHYDVKEVENSLGLSAHNYGWDGSSIIHQYLCLLKALDNGGLKIVVLDLSPAQIGNEWVVDRISDYWPYYWQNDTVRKIVNEVEDREMKYMMLSSLIQYNSQTFNTILTIKQYKGFYPLSYSGKQIQPLKSNISSYEVKQSLLRQTNSLALKYLKRMNEICSENEVKLVACLSPTLSYSQGNDDYLSDICSDCGIEFWNMNHIIEDGFLFSDAIHLNEKGARLFTDSIIERIRPMAFSK